MTKTMDEYANYKIVSELSDEQVELVLEELKLEYKVGHKLEGLLDDLYLEVDSDTWTGSCTTGSGFIEDVGKLKIIPCVWIYGEEAGYFINITTRKEEALRNFLITIEDFAIYFDDDDVSATIDEIKKKQEVKPSIDFPYVKN